MCRHHRLAAAIGAGLLSGAAVGADPPAPVRVQPDPFDRLQTLDAGRIASSWSSLPETAGCAPDTTRLSAHALLLGPAPDPGDGAPLGGFSLVDSRQVLQLDATAEWGCLHGQLALQHQQSPRGEFTAWDGTALAWQAGDHWRLGIGRIARQWGPGWDGSLILGAAARPFVNASVDATSGRLDDSRWWWWLGEVEATAFFGELEGERGDHPRPYLMGARVVVRPWPWLELAASRTAMWGGEGRDTSWDAFLRSLFGLDNQANRSSADEEPGNQLAGFDGRLDLSALLPGVALYGQAIGEDEASHRPSKFLYQAGADWRHRHGLVFAEWTQTRGGSRDGLSYQHHIFTDGYRYKGLPLGHWADGDSTLWSVGGLLRDLAGGQGLAVLRSGKLNQDGQNPIWPDARLSGLSLQWRTQWERIFGLTLVLDHADLRLDGSDARERDTQLRVQLEVRFD
jgi:hypothetical protein